MGLYSGNNYRLRTLRLTLGCIGIYIISKYGIFGYISNSILSGERTHSLYTSARGADNGTDVRKRPLNTLSRIDHLSLDSGELAQPEKHLDKPKLKRGHDTVPDLTHDRLSVLSGDQPTNTRGSVTGDSQPIDTNTDASNSLDEISHTAPFRDVSAARQGGNKTVTSAHTSRPARISYVFLTHDSLPLWDVWTEYFRTCTEGSYDIVVHSQLPMTVLGGPEVHYVARSQILHGPLRFSVNMLHASFHLYRSALERGCGVDDALDCEESQLPDFIQLLSDSCAPIMTCHDVHAYTGDYRGASFVEAERNPYNGLLKGSQWIALTGTHALELVRNEDRIVDKWDGWGGGAPDEYAIPDIMQELKLPIHHRVLTFAVFKIDSTYRWFIRLAKKRKVRLAQIGDYSHPSTFQSTKSVALMMWALQGNNTMAFARKVEPGPASDYIIETLKKRRKLLRIDGQERGKDVKEN
ncbi:hypothetical protein SARC_00244 [Sphaeroforma arctica JP610]|uniref:Uncharacterized protein n=1 Tax=Sphaeroforma arctica JP610 TaxID=667725 RepID=A0A0L0GH69_9EUKA|nr:hypothetical protein SARC_00244 [Sphaeroforma arctica JP610]KNC87673.1 hypothetical protein SARC_00244 [Sphaeroforma arctica JP610]|eukprot:XP_014161575.1 hypothetical protein SARC_00244 [Sphaeroforma arctica JP610]